MINENKVKYLEKYLLRCIYDEAVFPGAEYAIVTKDSQYVNALGYSQIVPKKIKIKEDTIFDIASLTKVVATTPCIILLLEYGEISLDTKIQSILPDFKHENIRVIDLLTHTSGLPGLKKYYKECKDLDEMKQSLYSTDLVYKTGEKVLYSDLGFILLGLIIERITGSFTKFASKELFVPLEMEDTGFNPSAEKKERCAATEDKENRGIIKGEVHDGNAYFMGGVSGHAGLFSTAKDLSNYTKMILNNGYYKNQQILNGKSIRLMRNCFTKDLNEKRGLGWMVNYEYNCCDLASSDAIYHTGFTGTSILIDEDFAFILLTNRVHPSRDNTKLIKTRRLINNIASTTTM